MRLILEAIKALFRKAETGISTLSGRMAVLDNRLSTLSKRIATAQNTVSTANNTAKKALTLVESKPSYVSFDWGSHPSIGYYDITQRGEQPLNPGDTVYVNHNFTREFLDQLPMGSVVSTLINLKYADEGTPIGGRIALEKSGVSALRGGFWVNNKAGKPCYYHVDLHFHGAPPACTRYV